MVGIVILNYNTWNDSIKCIESIVSLTTVPYKIYLVDNCSDIKPGNECLKYLCDYNVELIYSDANLGYAAGNNLGLRKAYNDGCSGFIITNSDVVLLNDCITKMVKYTENILDVGIVGPLIYDKNKNFQPIYMLSRLNAMGKVKNMMLKTPLRVFLTKFQDSFIKYDIPDRSLRVFSVSGCFFYITKKCYEKVFPFDENTFLYEEEYILGCRLENENIAACIIPDASIMHMESSSIGAMSDFSYTCLMKSEEYYLKEYIHESLFMRYIVKILRKIIWRLFYKKR
ncbi:glycosyltransferase [Selenomonas sp. ND2010]|uniref:glycosyltransferase n=1 Tax=Selenomonas sp. ND2010 TaxID=1410618 RepID=UPI00051B53CF|nr:glycosyltransferase family 2 protein [Selenomonas sp. ND2010]